MARRIVVGITGATGVVYGVRLLQQLRAAGVESHVVMSNWGARTALHELGMARKDVEALADVAHNPADLGATISSGSFRTDGMVVAPCSAKSLAAIAHGYGDTLIHRAADVMLKERRRLVLLLREAPLSAIHLENALTATRAGAVILPPMPAFYQLPATVDDLVAHTVERVLDQFDIEVPGAVRWDGDMGTAGVREDA